MQNDLNDLFARIDADPTLPQPGDIDKLVAYYREQRAQKGLPKTQRAKPAVGPKIDLAELGLKPKPVGGIVRRRI